MPQLYISPLGSGLRDGSSAANAGTLSDLPAFVAAAGPDGEVLLIADKGAYTNSGALSIVSGGTDGHPVSIRGIDSDGNPAMAEIVGHRADPYVANASSGEEVFRLLNGADHLVFSEIEFKNISYAAIRVGADIEGLTIEHVRADNVQRFLEDFVSGDNVTATISGLIVRDVEIKGFSKGAIRLQYDSHDILIEDVVGDSERQNGENFAIGVHMGGTVHDVLLERVTMRNAFDNVSGAYWQGDGFASEKGVYDVTFIDTIASNNTDAGYDLKSSSTTLIRAVSDGNGRNFRIWGQDVVIEDAVSLDPQIQGGIANQQHFGFARGAQVTIINPYLSDSSAVTTAFDATEGRAKVSVIGASLHLNASAPLVRSADGSVVTFTGTDTGIGVTGAGIADFSGEAHGVYAYGDGAAQTLIGSEHDDVLQGLGGSDRLVGGDGADRLDGGAGNDVLEGGAGGDLLIGGAGFDFADYHLSDAGISVDLASGAPSGGAEGDLLEGIEGLIGSALQDDLRGDVGINILLGGDGTDTLDGRAGDDVLVGGGGADRIIGGDGVDTVDYSGSVGGVVVDLGGGPGSGAGAEGDIISGVEVVIGSAFADLLKGSEGDDLLIGGAGADQFVGGAGMDTVDFSSNGVAIAIELASGLSSGGDAEGDSFSGIEIIRGTAFDDVLTGDATGNVFYGSAGADRLDGAGGDDLLIGGAGADAFIGGSGSDTVDYSANATAVIVDLLAGTAQGGDATGDTLNTIENILGTAFTDAITGDASDNRLDGGAGDDWLRGGAGADMLIGGAGVDTADYGNATAGVVFAAMGAGIGGDAAGDSLQSIEIVVGSQFGDVLAVGASVRALYGAAGDDTLNGSAGDDLLVGGAGADRLSGGAGIDTADYSASASGVSIDLGENLGSGSDAEGDSFQGIERLVGSQFDDSLRGDGLDNILIGGSGADSLSGGGGFDTVDYSASGSAVVVDIAAGVGSGGDAQGDVFAQIDAIIGSAFADNLTGDDEDNRLVGGAGADRLVGGGGRDLADYGTNAAAVRIDLSTGLGTGGDAAGDTLSGIEDVMGSAGDDTLIGDAGANTLSGGAGKDIIDGGAGDDLMIGGTGDDQYTVDSLGDVVVENLGSGSDRINTTLSSYVLGSNFETLAYTGIGSFTGYGNELTNSFVGSAGSETYYGMDGDDRFFGSAGADTFYGGAGANSADYSKSKTSITISLDTNVNLKGDAEGDLLYDVKFVSGSDVGDDITGSNSGETLYGRGGVDLLYGLDGGDTLDGGAGADRLEGGNGNDTYVVDVVGDQVIEAAGGGKDLVKTTLATYTLGDNLEGLAHTGTRAFTGVGNALDNELFGGGVGDTLIGGDGNDILMGRGGADLLDGGEGSDTASYASSTTGVIAGLATGVGYAGEAQGDRYVSIENLLGSARADQLTGDDQANRLDGGAGTDHLQGGRGGDTIVGGAGSDLIDGGEGIDTVEFSGAIQDYGFALKDGAIVVTDLRVGAPDGIDTVNNAEFFRFNGESVSRDAIVTIIETVPPNAITLSGTLVAEEAAPGVVVGTAVGSDETPGETLTYSLAGDADGRFVIDAVTGVLSIAEGALFDHETEPSVAVVIVAHDAGGLHLAKTFDITIGNVNEAPDDLVLTGGAIVENAGGGIVVGSVAASDQDIGDVLHYSLTDDAEGRFAIDAVTGVVTTTAGADFDYETAPGHQIDVEVTDVAGATLEKSFAIAIDDVNEAPISLSLTGGSITDAAAPGALVGTVLGLDPDIGDTLSYSLLDDAGGRFTVDQSTGAIRVAADAHLEAVPGGYQVTVGVQDAAGATYAENFSVAVTFTDPFKGDKPDLASNTFIVDTRAGGVSGARPIANFGVNDVLLTTKKIPDGNNDGIITFGSGGVLSLPPAKVTISTPDGAAVTSLEYDGKIGHGGVDYYVYSRIGSTAGLADVHFPAAQTPLALALSNAGIAENAAAGTLIGAVSSDAQPGGSVAYALLDNAEDRFTINPATGELRLAAGALLDFETTNVHNILVSATSGSQTVQRTFAIAVGDVNEAPIGLSVSGGVIGEGATVGAVVATIKGFDRDAGDSLSYSLLDNAAGRFSIEAGTGVIRVAGHLDYEAAQSHQITVRAVDSGGLSYQQVVVIGVTDVVESFTGTAGADSFVATTSDNWNVSGLAGNDLLKTLDGADVITGGAGDDTISAGDGNDVIRVTSVSDGYDAIDGGFGDDLIVAQVKNGVIGLRSLSGVETISSGGFAGVTIGGSEDADLLDFSGTVLQGITRISGNGGKDTIIGSAAADVISGGAGDDVLAGGAGDDAFLFYAASGRDSIDGGDGFDTVRADANDAVFVWGNVTGVEAILANGFGAVDIVGTTAADSIDLTGIVVTGIRAINGGDGADQVTGSAGADTINGGRGDDVLSGAGGDDVFVIGTEAGSDTIVGGEGFDTIKVSKAGFTLDWTKISEVEAVNATGFAGTVLSGSTLGDLLDLSIVALTNVARIEGAGGADDIRGSAGADVISGGAGRDLLTSNGGADIFDFDAVSDSGLGAAADIVTDFTVDLDRIDLSTIDASTKSAGNQAFTFIGLSAFGSIAGQLRIDMSDPAVTRILGDIDGNGVADFEIDLIGLPVLTISDFLL